MGSESGIPFGNYTLLKRIARGGMAEVFVARQMGIDGFDRLVAIKRILPHLVDQMRGRVAHASCGAGGTEAAPFA